MPHLVRLNLSYNHLTNIPEGTFVDQVKMDWLLLNDNDIDYIHPLSFPVHSDLKILNLSRNSRLKEWVPGMASPNWLTSSPSPSPSIYREGLIGEVSFVELARVSINFGGLKVPRVIGGGALCLLWT